MLRVSPQGRSVDQRWPCDSAFAYLCISVTVTCGTPRRSSASSIKGFQPTTNASTADTPQVGQIGGGRIGPITRAGFVVSRRRAGDDVDRSPGPGSSEASTDNGRHDRNR